LLWFDSSSYFLCLGINSLFGFEQNIISSDVASNIRVIDWNNFVAPSLLKYISKDGAQISVTKTKDGISVPVPQNLVESDATIKTIV
jgi:hypothetical protein